MANTKHKPDITVEQRCAAQHFGPWMIESEWFTQAVNAVKAGTFVAAAPVQPTTGTPPPYQIVDGIAVIPIFGQITKGESSFGGASSVAIRRSIRMAVNDDRVEGIMLQIDSPGGTVAGTGDLAADVRQAASVKPVHSYIEDLGASAAYWIVSQTSHVAANATAQVGSIGTVAVVEDTSGAAERAGVKVYVVSTGKHKGAFVDGAPVTEEQLAELQSKVNEINEHFLAAVMEGRGMSRDKLDEIADGRVFIADKALKLGLIDEVSSFDAAFSALSTEIQKMDQTKFNTLKAENPSWIAAEMDQAKRAGLAEARSEMKTFLAAFPSKPLFAAEQFAAGRTLDEAKSLDADITKATAEKDAALAAKDAEIAKLKATHGTQGPIETGAVGASNPNPISNEPAKNASEANTRAETEWANHPSVRDGFDSKENYVAWRSAVLLGQHKSFTRKAQ